MKISLNYRFLPEMNQIFNPFAVPINPESAINGYLSKPFKAKVAMKRSKDPFSSTNRKSERKKVASNLKERYGANCRIQRYSQVNFKP